MRKEKLENVRAIDIFDGVSHFSIDNLEEVYIRDKGVEVIKKVNKKKYRYIYATPNYRIAFKEVASNEN
ncbi:hypothetical protein [Holzapfeliella sp. JNUCC 80]